MATTLEFMNDNCEIKYVRIPDGQLHQIFPDGRKRVIKLPEISGTDRAIVVLGTRQPTRIKGLSNVMIISRSEGILRSSGVDGKQDHLSGVFYTITEAPPDEFKVAGFQQIMQISRSRR